MDSATLARRLKAARELRGCTREELAKLMIAEGFGKHDVAKMERADPKLRMTRPRRQTLARLLEVPEEWFTSEDEELFAEPEQTRLEWLISENASKLDLILKRLQPDELRDAIDLSRRTTGAGRTDHGDESNQAANGTPNEADATPGSGQSQTEETRRNARDGGA